MSRTTKYIIKNDVKTIEVDNQKAASGFLGIATSTLRAYCFSGRKCHGYVIEREKRIYHGESRTRLHKIWSSMLERCENKNHRYYKNYGGRGIYVCVEWHSYVNFSQWAKENGYDDNLSIDREDNNGNYEPENCRWITKKAQANNKRTNHIVELNGEKHTISEWSEMLGISKTTIRERLKRGWTVEDALLEPVHKKWERYKNAKEIAKT